MDDGFIKSFEHNFIEKSFMKLELISQGYFRPIKTQIRIMFFFFASVFEKDQSLIWKEVTQQSILKAQYCLIGPRRVLNK